MSNLKHMSNKIPGTPKNPAIRMVTILIGIVREKYVPKILTATSSINPIAELISNFHKSFKGLTNTCPIIYNITSKINTAIAKLMISIISLLLE